MPKRHAYLVYDFYGHRNKPMCVIIANSIEQAIRQTGGEPTGLFNGEFHAYIPLKKCRDSGRRGCGEQHTFVYTKGSIRLEIDANFFTGGNLSFIEVPLFPAAS